MEMLLLGKRDSWVVDAIESFCRHRCGERLTIFRPLRDGVWPDEILHWSGTLIFSVLCPLVVPAGLLRRTNFAINLHPGSPDYPGTGCTNFALYEEAQEYGVTAHHMSPSVDTGHIIDVVMFPVYENETVWSLTQRTYGRLLALGYSILDEYFLSGKVVARVNCGWKRKPLTRQELEDLCRIVPWMTGKEVRRRVRATTFPGMPGAYIELEGVRFRAGDV